MATGQLAFRVRCQLITFRPGTGTIWAPREVFQGMYGRGHVFMGFRMDPGITKQKLKPGTVRRIAAYARPYRLLLAVFLLATVVDALITVVNPLLLREIIDHGILGRNDRLVIEIAVAVAAVAVFDAAL